MLIFLCSCTSSSPDSADDSSTAPPGDAVSFHEVAYGEVGGPDSVKGATACETAVATLVGSEKDLRTVLDTELQGLATPTGIDWTKEDVVVAYIAYCTHGKQDLEMTDVWDLGGGVLQVDLTFHDGPLGTGMMARAYTIATVPAGSLSATANLSIDDSDTGFGSRD